MPKSRTYSPISMIFGVPRNSPARGPKTGSPDPPGGHFGVIWTLFDPLPGVGSPGVSNPRTPVSIRLPRGPDISPRSGVDISVPPGSRTAHSGVVSSTPANSSFAGLENFLEYGGGRPGARGSRGSWGLASRGSVPGGRFKDPGGQGLLGPGGRSKDPGGQGLLGPGGRALEGAPYGG